jgi:spore coat polysaccharide biosynthesis protein SpsF (cytidylyltransferase family)/aryl-alcohol dehydrogenase-like predicted oxidoreductase
MVTVAAMTRVRVVIQARMLSQRLPGKAVLPVAGYPAVALCALRAANRGLDVVVATGEDPSNNPIVESLASQGIAWCRGPDADVLARYVRATGDLPPEALVVRLTADNLFPDGDFLDRLLQAFQSRGLDYLGCHSPLDGLPYGLSAEVFSVAALRESHEAEDSARGREHVTPWLRRQYGGGVWEARKDLLLPDYSHLRCTFDTIEDYLRLRQVFENVADPVGISWRDLVQRLAGLPGSPTSRVPYKVIGGEIHGSLTLGTAQLGMAYGAANLTGPPTFEEAVRMVREAVAHGITSIDTARAYGDGENRLGQILDQGLRRQVTVITKLDPLDGLSARASEKMAICSTDASVYRSCRELNTRRLEVLLLHRWEQRHQHGEAIWRRLLDLREEGVIGELGASVYEPEQAIQALEDEDVKYLQIPFNVLDWRWRSSRFQQKRAARLEVVVHGRSALLQGLLVAGPFRWPSVQGVNPDQWLKKLDYLVAQLGRESRADLCLAYVRGQPWLTSIVVGMETLAQLYDNIRMFQKPALTAEECRVAETLLAGAPEGLLNPRTWRLRQGPRRSQS